MRARRTGNTAGALEFKLLEHLRIPLAGLAPLGCDTEGAASPPSALPARPGWEAERVERLRRAVWELRQDAAAIGTIPSGYPRHIEFIMQAVSALLPWYTRSLVRFGQKTVETVEAMTETIEEALGRQPPR